VAKKSKRYRRNLEKLGGEKRPRMGTAEAIKVLKSLEGPKFDQTVELVLNLGIDPRKSDQQVRGTLSLPHGLGKERKVVVFAEGEAAEAAKEAGADYVGGVDLVQKVQKEGWTDFDVAIAIPDMMRHVSKLGRILGPQGKMPSSKTGTVTNKVAEAVKEFKFGRVEYRNDSTGNVHIPVGKLSFETEKLVENIQAAIEHIKSVRPAAVKGAYLKKAFVSATMTPAIELIVER